MMTSRVQTTALQQDTSAAPHLAKVVQRSCACGEAAGMTDSCESCAANDLAGTRVQAKLVVGPVNDPYEQEADRVADQVMRMPDSDVTTSENDPGPVIQRACTDCEEEELQRQPEEDEEESIQGKREGGPTGGEVSAQQTAEIESIKTGGEPLRAANRSFFEQRFGHDFSSVRIHSDDRAAQSAKGINAQAYTTGQHIIFGTGHYSPDTQAGQRLLAHELTHVVQQGGAGSRSIQRKATWTPLKPTEPINPAQQIGENIIPKDELFLGETNFRLNGTSFTKASVKTMTDALNKPKIDHVESTISTGQPSGSGSGSGSASGSGSGSGSGTGQGSGSQKKSVKAFECWVDSVPENVGSNEVKLPTQKTWVFVTDKKNVGARFPKLTKCANGYGKCTFRVDGDPDDKTVREQVRVHEQQHENDNKKVFDDLLVPWDTHLTDLNKNKDKIRAKRTDLTLCEQAVFSLSGKNTDPETLVKKMGATIDAKGKGFHNTAPGKTSTTTPDPPQGDCDVQTAKTKF